MFTYDVIKTRKLNVSNVTYHKFSHGAISYMLNGENVNVMLELAIGQGFLLSRMTTNN